MKRYFKCKFIPPKDFLGLDITISKPGDITLGMNTFTAKMVDALQVYDDYPIPTRKLLEAKTLNLTKPTEAKWEA